MQTDLERLQAEISRLMAALEDVNFECQRLEIVNKNLDFQLKEANRSCGRILPCWKHWKAKNRALRARLQEQE